MQQTLPGQARMPNVHGTPRMPYYTHHLVCEFHTWHMAVVYSSYRHLPNVLHVYSANSHMPSVYRGARHIGMFGGKKIHQTDMDGLRRQFDRILGTLNKTHE